MRLIEADRLKEALKQNLPQYLWGEMFVTVNIQPTITTKQVKYYDEDENVWKIGAVIADGEREGE